MRHLSLKDTLNEARQKIIDNITTIASNIGRVTKAFSSYLAEKLAGLFEMFIISLVFIIVLSILGIINLPAYYLHKHLLEQLQGMASPTLVASLVIILITQTTIYCWKNWKGTDVFYLLPAFIITIFATGWVSIPEMDGLNFGTGGIVYTMIIATISGAISWTDTSKDGLLHQATLIGLMIGIGYGFRNATDGNWIPLLFTIIFIQWYHVIIALAVRRGIKKLMRKTNKPLAKMVL